MPRRDRGLSSGGGIPRTPAGPPVPDQTSRPVAVWGPPLDGITGGNLYDRMLVRHLRRRGHAVEVREFGPGDEPTPEDAAGAAAVIQDELLHRVFTAANRKLRERSPRPRIIALVHHLGCEEPDRTSAERSRLRKREAEYLATVDAVLAPSRASALAAIELAGRALPFVIAPPGRDRLGGGPMPAGRPEPEEVAARANESLQAVFVGNLIPRKRVLDLLDAVATVPAWRLAIAGREDAEPAYAARVRARAKSPDLRDRVELAGTLDSAALAGLLRSSQVLAVPSTHEGFGMVYLEGFAFGLPALAAADGGAPELVTDGVTGFLISARDPASRIAACLRALAGDRKRLARMALAARSRYLAHPSWSESLEGVRQLLPDR